MNKMMEDKSDAYDSKGIQKMKNLQQLQRTRRESKKISNRTSKIFLHNKEQKQCIREKQKIQN